MSSLKMVATAVFLVALVALAAPAYAINTYWSHDPATTGLWSDPLNWNNGVPASGDYAYIDNGGTAQIDSGAQAYFLYLGYYSSGTIRQEGGTTTMTLGLILGRSAGSTGTYYLDAGELNITNPIPFGGGEWVGYGSGSTGTFNQTGGTNTVSSNLYLGYDAGSSGDYNLDAGSLTAGTVYVGYSGQGTFNQTGGTNTVTGSVYLRNSGSAYNLHNGSLTAAAEYVGYGSGSTGAFNQSGGTNNAGYFNVTSSGTYLLEGGTLNIGNSALIQGTLNCNNGNAALNVNGGLADFSGANITNAGSTSFTSAANTLIIFKAGFDPATAFGSYNPLGMVHVEGNTLAVNAGEGFAGNGTISDSVLCEGSIAGSLQFSNDVTVTNGGSIAGALRFNNNVTVTNGGSITTSTGFSPGDVTISDGGRFDLDGQTLTMNTGKTLTMTATADYFKTGTLIYGGAAIVQSGGTNNVGYLNAQSTASYRLEGGTLNIGASALIQGTFDCNNGNVALNINGGLADFSGANIANAGSTSFTSAANTLTIFRAGFDPLTAFGSYNPAGMIHTAGNTLVVHAGEGFTGRGTINDPIECAGTITAAVGPPFPAPQTTLQIMDNVRLFNGGSLNLSSQYFYVASNKTVTIEASGGSIMANSEYLYDGSTFNQRGGTVLAGSFSDNATSSYNLEGGLLSAAYQSHQGAFTQTGGTNAAGNFYLYPSVYHLIDGTLDVTWDGGREYMGYFPFPPPSPPPAPTLTEFVQSGGINKTSFLDIIGASGYEVKYALVAGKVFVENNITIGAQSYFADDSASSGGSIYTSGNFLNNSVKPELFSMVHTTLTMYGEAAGWPAILDTNSVNRGNSLQGLDDNFALGTLIFEGSTVSTTYYYRLGSDVYTYGLVLRQGALLDLNGHTLYYVPVGYSYNGIAPATFCMTGGWINGNIVPLAAVCEPGTVAMVVCGFLGLAGTAAARCRKGGVERRK